MVTFGNAVRQHLSFSLLCYLSSFYFAFSSPFTSPLQDNSKVLNQWASLQSSHIWVKHWTECQASECMVKKRGSSRLMMISWTPTANLSTWSQFHQHFTSSFCVQRSQKCKKTWLSLFAILGSLCLNAVCKYVSEIDYRSQFLKLFTPSFLAHKDPKSAKRNWQLDWIFTLLGSLSLNAACKHFGEIDYPDRSQFH